ncbi:hypothetical protein [Dongia rigui]|uniref:Uncharacterized protein n=1 Tax=Dongia rigui TaxID=940149 RepID=A0ABU5DT39_9PROT|nr:hypothetical protein [Dongia rigui]MDY0870521.1 hypothetical protein [Dongia rigui]
MSAPQSLPEHEDLATAIAELAAMINETKVMADAGQLVELDLLAMRIAVLCDAVGSLSVDKARPLRPALETLMGELDRLDFTLRRRNVDLSLDLQQADRRLRAQLAYGPGPGKKPGSAPERK